MNVLIMVGIIVLILASLCMIGLVLMQDTKSGGIGSSFGGNTDSFYGRNKSKTREGRLSTMTKVLAGVIAVVCIVTVLLLKWVQ